MSGPPELIQLYPHPGSLFIYSASPETEPAVRHKILIPAFLQELRHVLNPSQTAGILITHVSRILRGPVNEAGVCQDRDSFPGC